MDFNGLAFDDRWAGSHGIGRFASEISNRFEFNYRYKGAGSPSSPLSALRLGFWLERSGAQALFSPGYVPPVGCRLPFIFTIHDLNHLDVRYNSSFAKRIYYKEIILPAVSRARRVLTVSEFSKGRIIDWSGCDARKVCVVGNGVSDAFNINVLPVRPGFEYFFCCSNRKGHKNEARLIQAFAHSKLKNNFKLVFTGDLNSEINNFIKKYKLEEAVTFTGSVSEELLASWYKGAVATVFPSLYEGFGLPVIESMACGTPVIASNTTSLPEVGGDAAVYFDPMEVESISIAMTKVVSDQKLRHQMISLGAAQASVFSWDKTAELMGKAFNSLL